MKSEVLTVDNVDIFDLDLHRLEEEWQIQPKLFRKHSRELAHLRAEWERAKTRRDLTEAKVEMQARRDPDSFGIEKKREAAFKQAVILSKEWQKANEEVIVAKYRMDEMESDVRAIEHRKEALTNMVKLRLADYYADPIAKGEELSRMDRDSTFRKRRKIE